jgi:hypothetical protein
MIARAIVARQVITRQIIARQIIAKLIAAGTLWSWTQLAGRQLARTQLAGTLLTGDQLTRTQLTGTLLTGTISAGAIGIQVETISAATARIELVAARSTGGLAIFLRAISIDSLSIRAVLSGALADGAFLGLTIEGGAILTGSRLSTVLTCAISRSVRSVVTALVGTASIGRANVRIGGRCISSSLGARVAIGSTKLAVGFSNDSGGGAERHIISIGGQTPVIVSATASGLIACICLASTRRGGIRGGSVLRHCRCRSGLHLSSLPAQLAGWFQRGLQTLFIARLKTHVLQRSFAAIDELLQPRCSERHVTRWDRTGAAQLLRQRTRRLHAGVGSIVSMHALDALQERYVAMLSLIVAVQRII